MRRAQLCPALQGGSGLAFTKSHRNLSSDRQHEKNWAAVSEVVGAMEAQVSPRIGGAGTGLSKVLPTVPTGQAEESQQGKAGSVLALLEAAERVNEELEGNTSTSPAKSL